MLAPLLSLGLRTRLLVTRALARLGFSEGMFLVPLALLIGIVTAGAAVAFHELIEYLRELLYHERLEGFLYGKGVFLLILFPALGGLAVGLFSTFVMRSREGHGVVDVMELVTRGGGGRWLRPLTAVEKILTSAVTIGTGGSAGAEGPIVQIGASIASGVGQLFQVARPYVPVLIGCGTAAGISAIFNSPIGGVLFTLEVILLDFSIRAFTPVVIASVVANVTTQAIFRVIDPETAHRAIFFFPTYASSGPDLFNFKSLPNFFVLGLACGLVGVALTRMMYWSEGAFHRLPVPRWLRPGIGGALLGVLGVGYVVGFGWWMLGKPKPFDFFDYPMPAFYGDGYGVVEQLLGTWFYGDLPAGQLSLLLAALIAIKVVATCFTLSSGGSGGIIAPSLFLGAVGGSLVGVTLQRFGLDAGVEVGFYALIGMGAVLAAVVHAPLAAILIVFEVTGQSRNVILPAMLACVVATGAARLIFRDSVYTLTLRRRGVKVGSGSDLSLLRRLTVEQVGLEPVNAVRLDAPFEAVLDAARQDGAGDDFVVVDRDGGYAGMVVAADVKTALLQRDAVPLLLVGEVVRPDLPPVKSTDDLATVLEAFTRHDISRLPVCLPSNATRIIGLVSRGALMRRYHEALSGD